MSKNIIIEVEREKEIKNAFNLRSVECNEKLSFNLNQASESFCSIIEKHCLDPHPLTVTMTASFINFKLSGIFVTTCEGEPSREKNEDEIYGDMEKGNYQCVIFRRQYDFGDIDMERYFSYLRSQFFWERPEARKNDFNNYIRCMYRNRMFRTNSADEEYVFEELMDINGRLTVAECKFLMAFTDDGDAAVEWHHKNVSLI